MRILICDDDTLIIEQLQKYIESYFESNHLKCPELVSFTSGESLLADKNEKDIVFLDIEMPGMNGIYVGNELKKANKNVLIFVVTSYSGNAFSCIPLSFQAFGQTAFFPKYERCLNILQFHYYQNSC